MERQGDFSEALDQDAKDLQSILNLTTRDAQVGWQLAVAVRWLIGQWRMARKEGKLLG